MTTLAKLAVELGLDKAGFERGVHGAAQDAESFSKRVSSAGATMVKSGAAITAGVTLPIALMGKQFIDAASDAEESANKVRVVFGKASREIEAFAATSATAMGMSRQQTLEAAGTFGNLFRAMGIATDQSADMSTGLLTLAADLASFNNANPEDVLLALRSGLVGEVEPLRKFGVNLSAARLESIALAQGIEKTSAEMTAAEKATFAFKAIMDDTALAQGDFARTSDGLANRQRIAAAQFADMKATLGQQLLPILLLVAGLAKGFGKLSPQMQTMILVGAGILAVIGPLVTAVGALVTVVGFLLSPIGLVLVAVAALGFILFKLLGGVDGIREKLQPVISFFQEMAAVFKAEGIGGLFDRLAESIRNALPVIGGALVDLGKAFVQWVIDVAPVVLAKLGELLVALGSWIVNTAAPRLGEALRSFVVAFAGWVAEAIPTMVGKLLSLLIALYGWIVFDALPTIIIALSKWSRAFLGWIIETIPKMPGILWDLAGTILSFLGSLPGRMLESLGDLGSLLYDVGRSIVSGLIRGIKNAARDLSRAVKEHIIGKLPGPVRDALGIFSPSKVFAGIGANITGGLVAGIRSGAPDLVRASSSLAGLTLGAFTPSALPSAASGGAAMPRVRSVAAVGADGPGTGDVYLDGQKVGRIITNRQIRGGINNVDIFGGHA